MWRAMRMRLPSLSICSRANVRNREHGTTGQAERSKKTARAETSQIPSARVQLLPILLRFHLAACQGLHGYSAAVRSRLERSTHIL
jgi:hypothetical protein